MSIIIKQSYKFFCIFLVSVFFLSSCSDSSSYSISHIPVKVKGDDDYSFVNLNTGEINFSDEYARRPSVIKDGVFYSKDKEGKLTYHRLTDLTGENVENNIVDLPGGPYINGGLFNDGVAIVLESNEFPKVIDQNGEIVFEVSNDDGISALNSFCSDGRIMFRSSENGLVGFLNKKGEKVIPGQFTYVSAFNKGFAKGIRINDNKREIVVINTDGDLVMSYDDDGYVGESLGDNFIAQVKEDKFALIDSEKEVVTSFEKKFDNVSVLGNNLMYKVDGKWGILSESGKKIIRAKYDYITHLDSKGDLFVATKDDKNEFQVFDSKGEKLFSDDGDAIGLSNDNFLVKDGSYWTIKSKDNKDLSDEVFRIKTAVLSSLVYSTNDLYYGDVWIESDYFDKSPILKFMENDVSNSKVLGTQINQLVSLAYQNINKSIPSYENDESVNVNETEYSFDMDYNSYYTLTFVDDWFYYSRFGMGFDEDNSLDIDDDESIDYDEYEEESIEGVTYASTDSLESENTFKSVAPELNNYTKYIRKNISLNNQIKLQVKFRFSEYILKRKMKDVKVESVYGSYITSKHVGNEWNPDSKLLSISGEFDIESKTPKAKEIVKELNEVMKNNGWTKNGKYWLKNDFRLKIMNKYNNQDVLFELQLK